MNAFLNSIAVFLLVFPIIGFCKPNIIKQDLNKDGKIDAIYEYYKNRTLIKIDADRNGSFENLVEMFYKDKKLVKKIETYKFKHEITTLVYPNKLDITFKKLNSSGKIIDTYQYSEEQPGQ